MIQTAEGGRTCPSVVAFGKDGEVLIGELAKRWSISESRVYRVLY